MLNYIGQLRLYSLIDLFILLVAIKATTYEFLGVVLLHIGFLAFLEAQHRHTYRKTIPKYIWLIFTFIGFAFYGHMEGIFFVICSYFYTLKTKKYFATVSPLIRGLQNFFLVAGIVGYNNKIIWLVLVLITIRNVCGDLRDIEKDRKENLKTLPIILGFKKNIKYIHLIATLATSLVWFTYTSLTLWLLIPIFIIQISTYNLTPR